MLLVIRVAALIGCRTLKVTLLVLRLNLFRHALELVLRQQVLLNSLQPLRIIFFLIIDLVLAALAADLQLPILLKAFFIAVPRIGMLRAAVHVRIRSVFLKQLFCKLLLFMRIGMTELAVQLLQTPPEVVVLSLIRV